LIAETSEQKRIREKAEQDVEDLARWQAQKQNLPKEYEEILVNAALETTRKMFSNRLSQKNSEAERRGKF
jgi:hypothetical protein